MFQDRRDKRTGQAHVYDAIVSTNGEYPYSTADWAIPAIMPMILSIPNYGLIFEIGANTGRGLAVMARLLEKLDPNMRLSYNGIDISSEAIRLANKKAGVSEQIQASFAVADAFADDLDPENKEKLQNADLITATYVGPSVGLKSMIEKLVANGRPFVLIDRLYTQDQAEGVAFAQMVRTAIDFWRYFKREGIDFPWAGFIAQIAQKPIYKDDNYKQDLELYKKNAPGNLQEFQVWLKENFGDKVKIRANFGGDTVIIEGNMHLLGKPVDRS